MALDLLAGSVVFQMPHKPSKKIQIRMGFHRLVRQFRVYNLVTVLSGPAMGVVAGSSIPNYCIMCDTANVARVMEKMGEGMRIHISSITKELLDKVGGFRCESRGILDLGVREKILLFSLQPTLHLYFRPSVAKLKHFGW